MLVKRSEIRKIDMVEYENKNGDADNADFCVRFHLESGYVILPCFYSAGFPLETYPDNISKQLERTQAYLDAYPPDAYIDLKAETLYDMNVYH